MTTETLVRKFISMFQTNEIGSRPNTQSVSADIAECA